MIRIARAVLPAAIAAALLAAAAPAAAQDPTGTIEGTVTDASQAAVAGARVSAQHLDTGFTREAVAGTDGLYRLVLLPVGAYRLTVAPTASARWSRNRSRSTSARHCG